MSVSAFGKNTYLQQKTQIKPPEKHVANQKLPDMTDKTQPTRQLDSSRKGINC
jgi:hypothetical protein